MNGPTTDTGHGLASFRALARPSVASSRPPAPLWIRTTLMFVQIFAIVASFTLTKAVRDAVFLSRFRMQDLAYVSLALAAIASVAVSLHQRFVAARFSRGVSASVTLFGVAASLLGFCAALRTGHAWVPWALYLWSGVFGLFLVAQFWITALDVFDAREAKRVFAVLAAGASLGGVAGGWFAQTLQDNIGEGGLLLTVAATFGVCAVLARVTWALRPREPRVVPQSQAETRSRAGDGFRALQESPLLRSAALVLLCSVVAGTLLDWQVKAIAKAHFHSDRGLMTAFFGQVLALASIVALVLQALTGPLLRRLGVAAGLVVLPTAMFGGALLFLGQGAVGLSLITVAVVAKSAEGGVRFSIDKAALELLYMPVQGRLRAAGKGLVDTVADRIGGAITALLWLGLQAVADVEAPANVHYASFVVVVVVVIWTVVALRARRRYLDAFRTALSRLELRPEKLTGRVADAAQRRALEAALASPRAAEVLLALDVLHDPANRLVRVNVSPALSHAQVTVRARALEVMAFRRDASRASLAAACALLGDPSPAVRVAAVRWATSIDPSALVARAPADLAAPARQLLDALLLPASERARSLGALARSRDPADRAVAAVLAAGTGDRALYEALLEDPHPMVARAAIAGLSSRLDERDLAFLLHAAARPSLRLPALEALARFGVHPALVASLGDPHAPVPERVAAAAALARTGSPLAIEPLAAALEHAPLAVRDAAVVALNKLHRDTGLAPAEPRVTAQVKREIQDMGKLSAAVAALQPVASSAPRDAVVALAAKAAAEAIEQSVERLFRLLGLVGEAKDMRDAYLSLRRASARGRATCVEFLDNVLPKAIRSLVVPIVEPADAGVRHAAMQRVAEVSAFASAGDAIGWLATHERPWLRAVGSAASLRLGVRGALPARDGEDDPRVQQVLDSATG